MGDLQRFILGSDTSYKVYRPEGLLADIYPDIFEMTLPNGHVVSGPLAEGQEHGVCMALITATWNAFVMECEALKRLEADEIPRSIVVLLNQTMATQSDVLTSLGEGMTAFIEDVINGEV